MSIKKQTATAPFKFKFKKIVLVSLGGSVGKTLITVQALHPHMPEAQILCVDQTNTTAAHFGIKNCISLSGEEFDQAFRHLMKATGDVIVDVGGTKECDQFLAGMLEIGSDAITHFIVPSKPDSKDQGCALDTIDKLLLSGVGEQKIIVVFTGTKKNTEKEFKQLIDGLREKNIEVNLDRTIFANTLFDDMIKDEVLITSILSDPTDYNKAAEERIAGDTTDYIENFIRKQKAERTVWPNLQTAYRAMFSETAGK